MDAANIDSLVRHAFAEQRALNLDWYSNMTKSTDALSGDEDGPIVSGVQFKSQVEHLFQDLWSDGLDNSPKLKFYARFKVAIEFEPYLTIKNREKKSAIARLRSSSHRLNIETGRYTLLNRTWNKRCNTFTADEAEDFIHLPFADPILEDETHVLVTCPRYHFIRSSISSDILCSILRWDWKELFHEQNINEFASYVCRIFQERFPKNRRPEGRF